MKFKVLKPIEHDQILYLPEGDKAPKSAASASHGREIPADASGVIELTANQADAFTAGQIEPIKKVKG